MAAHAGLPEPELYPVVTKGDRNRDRAVAGFGGKGVFTTDIDRRVLAGEADAAVHSMKDVESVPLAGIRIAAVLPREDAREAFVATGATCPAALRRGAVVGTSSVRRRAQLLARRPDLRVMPFRGNVDTRLAKLDAGAVEATVLALAGLKRLALAHRASRVLEISEMLPAAAQGAIGVSCRDGDEDARRLLAAIDHEPSALAVGAERALVASLDGSCRSPIAAHAAIENGRLVLDAMVLAADGAPCAETRRIGPAREAEALGRDAGYALLAAAGADLFGSRPG